MWPLGSSSQLACRVAQQRRLGLHQPSPSVAMKRFPSAEQLVSCRNHCNRTKGGVAVQHMSVPQSIRHAAGHPCNHWIKPVLLGHGRSLQLFSPKLFFSHPTPKYLSYQDHLLHQTASQWGKKEPNKIVLVQLLTSFKRVGDLFYCMYFLD